MLSESLRHEYGSMVSTAYILKDDAVDEPAQPLTRHLSLSRREIYMSSTKDKRSRLHIVQ